MFVFRVSARGVRLRASHMRLQCPPHRGGSSTRARRAYLCRGVRKASSGGPAWPPGTGPAARHAPEPRSRTSCSTWLGLGLGLVRVRVRVRGRVRAVGLRLGVRLGFKVRVRARTGRVVSTTRACRGTSAWKPPAYMAKAKAAGMRTQPRAPVYPGLRPTSANQPRVAGAGPGPATRGPCFRHHPNGFFTERRARRKRSRIARRKWVS